MVLRYVLNAGVRLFVSNAGLNPKVSCYLVLGKWVVPATTCWGGKPHAEALALASVGREAVDFGFVGLEPCSKFGKTPPCCYLLLAFAVGVLVVLGLDGSQGLGSKLVCLFGSLCFLKLSFKLTSYRFKYTRTVCGCLGSAWNRLSICASAPILFRNAVSEVCVSSSTLDSDDSALASRSSVLNQGCVRAVFGSLRLSLVCNLFASASCGLVLLKCSGLEAYRSARLILFGLPKAPSAVVFELGCLLARAASGSLVCVFSCSELVEVLGRLYWVGGGLVLNRRMFWLGSNSLSV
ncbi:hypothetical protein AAHH84_00020 [Candidatus Hodgkinia cicadicola]